MVNTMFYYFNMFIMGSILGFLWESSLSIIYPNINSGILYGPWVPIYGIGTCIIIFVARLVFNRIKVNKFLKIIITLLIIMLVVTFLEFCGGIFIEKVFHKTFWDYRNFKFHIGKYIALEITGIWGILSLLFMYVIKPLLEKIIEKIPKYVTILIFAIMLIDYIFTFLEV